MPPTVNPKFKDYVCFETRDMPWVSSVDINHDGKFGVDDLKAHFLFDENTPPVDSDQKTLDAYCEFAKIDFVRWEVSWKLKSLLLTDIDRSKPEALVSRIEQIKSDARWKLSSFSDAERVGGDWQAIVELTSRARDVVEHPDTTPELFGPGIKAGQNPDPGAWWQLPVREVFPGSAAEAAGIRPGDIIMAIDGRSIHDLNEGSTLESMVDSETQMLRGTGGARNSTVEYAWKRDGKLLKATLHRNVWKDRTLSKPVEFFWNGEERHKQAAK